MFDQVIAFCGTTITAADVHNVFGFTPRETVIDLGRALIARDTPVALALVKAQADAGKDLSRLLGDLIGLLRDILICKVHPPQGESDESRIGDAVSQEKLLVLLDHFGEAEGRLRWATDKKLQLDVALIKAVHLLEEASLSDVLDALSALRGGAPLPERPASRIPTRPTPTPSSSAPALAAIPMAAPVAPVTPAPPVPEAPVPVVAPTMEVPVEVPVEIPTPEPASADSPTSNDDPWQNVAMALASDSPLKFGWVEDGRLVERSGNTFIVEFPPPLQPQSQTLFWPQAVKKIEEQLSTLIGGKITFEYRFTGEEPPAPPEPEPVAAPQPKSSAPKPKFGEPPAKAPEPAAPTISPEELEAFKNDPLIKKALEIFKAEILLDPPKPA
jgi:DNA polymerase-3 subunit gamma/tau